FTKEPPKCLGSRRKFARHGQSGTYVSECLPHLSGVVDDLAVVRSVQTNVFNHAPAKFFINTGSAQTGRPSMGSWVTHGLGGETRQTLDLYGAQPGKVSFANNCLLARRLVERGVRFVQLYHTDWDHHGGQGANLRDSLDHVCKEIDRPCAALVRDLKRRGLLEDTLVDRK